MILADIYWIREKGRGCYKCQKMALNVGNQMLIR